MVHKLTYNLVSNGLSSSKGLWRRRLVTLPLASSGDAISGNDYLFGQVEMRVSFSSLSLSGRLCNALKRIEKTDATVIQAASVPPILDARDCIIASETGSGKTLAYLVPVVNQILEGASQGRQVETGESVHFPRAIVMVPNKDLCHQVHGAVDQLLEALCDEDAVNKSNSNCITAEAMTSVTNAWPYFGRTSCPDVLICTPAVLGNFVRGPVIVEPELFRAVRHLVLDEADMLLDGGYKKDLEKILDAFKVTRRRMIKNNEITVNDKILQVILSAATLPSMGELSIDNYVKKRFPKAVRISNHYLHKHHPRIEQDFKQVSSADFTDEHIEAIFNALGSDYEGEPTMLFANTAEEARLLAQVLRDEGLPVGELHKAVSFADREESLEAFRSGKLALLVCTDYAARGLDLPFVRHVIQTQFASNVVQHLHRIGRASRAGRAGRSTNIYGPESRDLVQSLLSDKEENKVDQSFSRRRGFRAKIKKARKRGQRDQEWAQS